MVGARRERRRAAATGAAHLVREAPLQLHEHGLAGQPVEEGLRVDDRRHPDAPIGLLDRLLRRSAGLGAVSAVGVVATLP